MGSKAAAVQKEMNQDNKVKSFAAGEGLQEHGEYKGKEKYKTELIQS